MSAAQRAIYDLFKADPNTRGDMQDYYRRGLAGIMKPDRTAKTYGAWLAGRDAGRAALSLSREGK